MATVRMPKYTYDQNTYALPLFFICERFWTCLKKGQQLTQKILCYPFSKIGVFDFLLSWIFRKKRKK